TQMAKRGAGATKPTVASATGSPPLPLSSYRSRSTRTLRSSTSAPACPIPAPSAQTAKRGAGAAAPTRRKLGNNATTGWFPEPVQVVGNHTYTSISHFDLCQQFPQLRHRSQRPGPLLRQRQL